MKTFEQFINEETEFPSAFGIGDPVFIAIQGCEIEGYVRFVGFSNGKVRYSISISIDLDDSEQGFTTFHNIDSVFIKGREGEKIEFEFDNYS